MRHSHTLALGAMLTMAGALGAGAQGRPQGAPPQQPPRADGGRPMPDGGHPMPGQMKMPMPGGPPAAHVLQMREHLGLSEDQVKRLETLAASQRTTLEPNRGAMLRAEADMADAMKGEGDLVAARAAMDKMSKLHNDEAIAHMKAMQEARSVLTADQRDKMRAMMPPMGMPHPPGQGGPNGMRPGGPPGPGNL